MVPAVCATIANKPMGVNLTTNLFNCANASTSTFRGSIKRSLWGKDMNAIPKLIQKTTTAGIEFSASERNGLAGINISNQFGDCGGVLNRVLKNDPDSHSGKQSPEISKASKPIDHKKTRTKALTLSKRTPSLGDRLPTLAINETAT